MDLTNKLKDFFNSDYQSFKEFEETKEKVLKETTAREAWVEAVLQFRTGMAKLKDKDLSGLDDIKKANVSLKEVITNYDNKGIAKQVEQLKESIEKVKVETVNEDVELLGYQLGALYDKLKEAGMPAMLNEAEMYEADDADIEECTPTVPVKEDVVLKVVKEDGGAIVDPANSTPATPNAVATTPTPSSAAATTPTPNMNGVAKTDASIGSGDLTEEVKVSAYEHGFNEARKRWKKDNNPKALAEEIAQKELSEKSYSYVNRWKEGFQTGHKFHEEYSKDVSPAMFEEESV
jgi:hypothetical protein